MKHLANYQTQNQRNSAFSQCLTKIMSQTDQIILKQQADFLTKTQLHDEEFSESFNQIISKLPNKVYQNCQRTARVIMLSQLQKRIGKNKKIKMEFFKKLYSFLHQKAKSQDCNQYNIRSNYFKSLHYSRVRVGQRYFINQILLSPAFKEIFQNIFSQKTYQNCQISRKNENSQVSFEKRKKITQMIIYQFQKTFKEKFSVSQSYKLQKGNDALSEKSKYDQNQTSLSQIKPVIILQQPPIQSSQMCIFYMPFNPYDYCFQLYQH